MQQGDGIGLVVFDDDDALGGVNGLHHGLEAIDDLVSVVQQQLMVGSQIRLALAAVEQHGLDGLAGLELDVGGEAGAAHADDTGVLDGLDDVIGGQLGQRLVGMDALIQGIEMVVFDDHGQAGASGGMRTILHGDDGAADGGVNRRGDKSGGLADDLTQLDLVTDLHNGVGRSAQVHGHGDDHGIGSGEADESGTLTELLVLARMHAAVVAGEAAVADGLDVVVDDLEVDLGVVANLDGLCGQLADAALGGQTLLNLFPGAVLVGIDLTLAVLRAAALAVDQALGAVHDGTDAAGDVEVALGAGIAGLLGQRHAVMAGVVEGVAGCVGGQLRQIGHGLNTETAGDHADVLGALGNQILKSFCGLRLVAQEIDLDTAGDGLALRSGELQKFAAIGLVCGFNFLEALVTSHNEQLVLVRQQSGQLIRSFQLVLGIIFQYLTFPGK